MELPRAEYPRPQWVRDEWLNLNGEWEFEEDPELRGEGKGWVSGRRLAGRILVPFAPESRLSGIGKTDFVQCVWYRRAFRLPEGWAGRTVLLHFGAVDYAVTVWVNGTLAGRHRGGYSSFSFDITSLLRGGENELVVRATDDTRSPLQASGKQSNKPESYGCMYTRTTGIWQTVWLEAVPRAHLKRGRLLADLVSSTPRLLVTVPVSEGAVGLTVEAIARADGVEVVRASATAGVDGACLSFALPGGRLWSPEDPFLYDLEIVLGRSTAPALRDDEVVDRVQSYFGMRHISLGGPAIRLNGRPVFQRLVLDQGYYPDGIYTAPSDEALRRDIELSQAMGFNGARLHQKVFEERFLYWADKLGYLVWGEYPSWGLDLAEAGVLGRVLPEWLEVVARDYSHPSIVGWCPFNETPNEPPRDVLRAVYWATKAVDASRPVIDASGYTHAVTDVDDCHDYEQDPARFREHHRALAAEGQPFRNHPEFDAPHRGQPFFVSEYGGIWWNPGQEDEKAWGYGDRPKSEAEFLARYRALTETLLFHPRMCGFCYTQLYDIEQEVNGLYTYDRRPKFDPTVIRAINEQKAAVEGDHG
ncbi:MAG: glycoside hydrolase family 2 protein [Armatimonadota bacterium]